MPHRPLFRQVASPLDCLSRTGWRLPRALLAGGTAKDFMTIVARFGDISAYLEASTFSII